ncbi:MAG: 3,8-cyclase MoaA [Pseudomonadota bacterium]
MKNQLVDNFGRRVNYLRISVTDRCDFRCVYCMDEKMQFLSRHQILSLEEIFQIAQAFVQLGVEKIRITGGEPLVRRNILWLFEKLSQLNGLKELVLTTNGSQLKNIAQNLKNSGVKRLNISLDTLKADRFQKITRTGRLSDVLAGIQQAKQVGFKRIKINSVIMKHRNADEIIDLVNFALREDLDITFIEEMPLGLMSDHDREAVFYSSDEVLQDLQQHFDLTALSETSGGPATYYQIIGTSNKIGFISPHSHNFCETCNRVRLTAEGRLLLCLGQEHSVDLRNIVRTYPNDQAKLEQTLIESMHLKPQGHDFNLAEQPLIFRYMNHTGG